MKLAVLTLTMVVFGFFLKASGAFADEGELVRLSHLQLQLVAQEGGYQPGENLSLAIRAVPEDGWHIYWKYPGDSGSTIKIDWSSSFGGTVLGPEFPIPKRIEVGPLVNFGYDEETLLLFSLVPQTNGKSAVELRADTEWLVCKEECIPVNANLSLTIFPRNSDASNTISIRPGNNWSEQISKARRLVPFNYPSVEVHALSSASSLLLTGRVPADKQNTKLEFFPLTPRIIRNAAPQTLRLLGNSFELSIPLTEDEKSERPHAQTLQGILVSSLGWTPDATSAQAINVDVALNSPILAVTPSSEFALGKFISVLLLAFAGGLILNVMPCVLPVLTLKILSLLKRSNLSRRQQIAQSAYFALGVLCSFLALGVVIVLARQAGSALGWGFQLQSPGFVSFLCVLTFLLSLNLLGIFEFGASIQRACGEFDHLCDSDQHRLGSFFEGVLMTALATPCTAPFMGSALAYGLSAPSLQLFSVFAALSLGLSLPFVLLTVSPKLQHYLPKPGEWMNTLKQILAFPLFATTIWLLWVLGLQVGVTLLSFQLGLLLLLGFVIWLYGSFAGPAAPIARRRMITSIAVLTLAFVVFKGFSLGAPTTKSLSWEPYSQQRVAELRKAQRLVYVDFTAAWCITCQVNKLVALNSKSVQDKLKELDVAVLEADWTNRDPEITRALSDFGREGVPLNVIYPADQSKQAIILPQILSSAIVLEALEQAKL